MKYHINFPVYLKINNSNKKLKLLLVNLLVHDKNILGAVREALSASLSSYKVMLNQYLPSIIFYLKFFTVQWLAS